MEPNPAYGAVYLPLRPVLATVSKYSGAPSSSPRHPRHRPAGALIGITRSILGHYNYQAKKELRLNFHREIWKSIWCGKIYFHSTSPTHDSRFTRRTTMEHDHDGKHRPMCFPWPPNAAARLGNPKKPLFLKFRSGKRFIIAVVAAAVFTVGVFAFFTFFSFIPD